MTKQQQTEHNMLMDFIEHDCKVDINEKIDYPPVCLSYGEKVIRSDKGDSIIPIALGTFGNLSVITAPPKTRKTFFVSLIIDFFSNNIEKKLKYLVTKNQLFNFKEFTKK